jgi:hypothetical protein
MKTKKLEELLYKSFDGILTIQEAELLKEELRKSPELEETYKRIKTIRNAVGEAAEDSFKPFFEERLLNKIFYPATKENVNLNWMDSFNKSFRQVAYAAVVVLTLLIIYNVNNGNISSLENLLGTYRTPIEYALDPSVQIFWSAL